MHHHHTVLLPILCWRNNSYDFVSFSLLRMPSVLLKEMLESEASSIIPVLYIELKLLSFF